MLNASEQIEILKKFVQKEFLEQARLLSSAELDLFKERRVVAGIKGNFSVEGKNITLYVGLDRRFPLSLPLVFLHPAETLGLIPHVNVDSNGYICYCDPEGILLNSEDPLGILQEAFTKSVSVLQAGVRGENNVDFISELGAYWRSLTDKKISAFLKVDQRLRKVFVYENKDGYALVADDLDFVRSYGNYKCELSKRLDKLTRRTALYIPLREGAIKVPPRLNKFWSSQEVKQIVWRNLSPDNRSRLRKLKSEWKSKALIVLGIPNSLEGTTLIGLVLAASSRKPQKKYDQLLEIPSPINLQRYDAEYLRPRGGVNRNLEHLKVLIVGCGAVGGFIIPAIAQAGIQNFTLVDPDIMEAENTFRHCLGRVAIERSKVEAMQEEVQYKYPYLCVTPHKKQIEDLLQDEIIKLSDFDLIVCATGKHTIELYLNRLLHSEKNNPPTVFTWLEPYGIGGHALLTYPGKVGCLQCLFTLDNEDLLCDRSAFAAPNQFFGRKNLGCGSSYTPYGSLDAQRTAQLAVRLALKAITEREQGSPILSWKGESEDFLAAGYKLSQRYKLTCEQLEAQKYSYIYSKCSVCSQGH